MSRRRLGLVLVVAPLAVTAASAFGGGPYALAGPTADRSARLLKSSASSCARYVIVDTRGSGEPLNSVSPPGARFVKAWKDSHKGERVQVVSNPYPASGWQSFTRAGLKLPGAYHSSVVEGKRWLAQFLGLLAQQSSPCAKQRRILLVGYSQGAQVTGDVVEQHGVQLAAGVFPQLLGVVLFGDPYFNSADPVDRGGFEHGRNGWLGQRALFSPSVRERMLSYCHAHDPVCQGPLHNGEYLTSQHTDYAKLGEPEEAARYFTQLESQAFLVADDGSFAVGRGRLRPGATLETAEAFLGFPHFLRSGGVDCIATWRGTRSDRALPRFRSVTHAILCAIWRVPAYQCNARSRTLDY